MDLTHRLLLCLVLSILLSSCQWLPWFHKPEEDHILIDDSQADKISYKVRFEDDTPSFLQQKLHDASLLLELKKRLPTSHMALYRRIKKDQENFEKVLDSFGFYDGEVTHYLVDNPPPDGPMDEEVQVEIAFKIHTKEQYRIKSLYLINLEPTIKIPSPQDLYHITKLIDGDPVNIAQIKKGAEKLRLFFAKRGYPFAKVDVQEGLIDRENKTLDVIYTVKPGIISRFGAVKIEGLKKVQKDFVEKRLLWQENQLYNENHIEKSKRTLIDTSLFSKISINPDETSRDLSQDTLPMIVQLEEAAPRRIGAGIKYASSEGASSKFFWKHNNVFGRGESFEANVKLGRRERKIKFGYTIPDFLKYNQELINEISLIREKTRAYVGKSAEISSILKSPLSNTADLLLGGVAETFRLRQDEKLNQGSILGAKIGIDFDNTNSLLDPSRGVRFHPFVRPYTGKLGQANRMSLLQIDGSFYIPLTTKTVLASWGRFGTIGIRSYDDIPFNKRFYAGGGSSVRGYGYQLLGPLNAKRTPLGGRSLFEFGTEIRLPLNDTFGVVSFIEAGSVGVKALPKFDKNNLLWAGGVGIRYYTAIGPIRFDIGIPFKIRRDPGGKKYDAPFQFYFSIGQAF
ncbi:MAG: BamA/TamA family outer membrane protein [Proteobacteria bacterium]|nr:BamA/TamA family outer membrane protein [Pseudomonadota bacterium]